MTQPELIELMRQVVTAKGKGGQKKLSQELGCSSSTLSQIMSDTYRADPSRILQKFSDLYSHSAVTCSVLGEITQVICAEERAKPFTTSRHRLFRACQSCQHNGGRQ
jgi:DNA-binding transcriptional regulator YdaS (Cro superfamily)